MKIIRFILFGAILQLNLGLLMAQTEKVALIKPFGIGLHIEQFKLYDLTDVNYAPANKLIFTISPWSSFRFEPEFGFRFNNDKTNSKKNHGVYFGLGAFKMIQHNKLNIYGGVRIEYASIKWNIGGSSLIYGAAGGNPTSFTTRFTIGPALGCEYYLGENFAFGGELGLKYASLKSTISDKELKSNYFTTDTGLFIRYYF